MPSKPQQRKIYLVSLLRVWVSADRLTELVLSQIDHVECAA
jgi:hypothetical protein